ncbi:MAG TPA: sulfite exporter TauE/SafE family protein [Usitatibacter sp.]|nr:sulfite exporter TauE/SafE family protein [Usitatibacter sp.]
MEAVLAALAAGFLGGVHCIGMCGGVSASLSAASRGPALRRLLAFNAGRIGSYGVAGALAGSLGSLAAIAMPLHAAQAGLAFVAAAFMVLLGLYVAGWSTWLARLEAAGGGLWRRASSLRARVVPIDSQLKALGAGALWGWVPCGMVYSMLLLALASGSGANGALVMAAFGAGTLPYLLAAGVAAQRLLEWRRHVFVRHMAGLAIIVFGAATLHRAPAANELLRYAWLCVAPGGS